MAKQCGSSQKCSFSKKNVFTWKGQYDEIPKRLSLMCDKYFRNKFSMLVNERDNKLMFLK